MTDDDELIERLRRTLHTEAAAITPNPEGQRAAPYPAPVQLHDRRPRWPLAMVAAAAVAAAVVVAALTLSGGGRSARIGIVGPGPHPIAGPTLPPPTVSNTTTTVPVTTTEPTATTVPVATTPVPSGFAPASVTFVSPSEGWVAGTVPCGSGSCLAMAKTVDGGQQWSSVPAPGGAVATPTGGPDVATVSVRFADPMDGWIYALPSRSGGGYQLWSTHDGGTRWNPVNLSALGSGAQITGMEASNGWVQVAIQTPGVTVEIGASPVGSDTWTVTATSVPIGAGPVPSTDLVLQNTSGWLVQNDRTVVAGARLVSGATWAAWTPPCSQANGAGVIAASSSTDMVAACDEGVWGPANNLPSGTKIPAEWLFSSGDAGASFQTVGPITSGFSVDGIATPAPATIVADGSLTSGGSGGTGGSGSVVGALVASFDGGHTWQTVYQDAQVTPGWADLGFTTLTQGVAIASTASASELLMTHDGGHTWAPVPLSAAGS